MALVGKSHIEHWIEVARSHTGRSRGVLHILHNTVVLLCLEITITIIIIIIKAHKTGRCTYNPNINWSSGTHCCRRKATNITYFQCMCVALGRQNAKAISCIILSPVACPALPYVYAYLINGGRGGGSYLNLKYQLRFCLQLFL